MENFSTEVTKEDLANGIRDSYIVLYEHEFKRLLKCEDKDIHWCNVKPDTKVVCDYAFADCGLLDCINLKSAEKIGQYAFDGCYGLKSVTSMGKLTDIGRGAFQGCKNLTSITTNGAEKIFAETFKRKYGKDVESVSITIPDCVSRIESYTFRCCTGLNVAFIGSNVQEICEGAFQGCAELNWLDLWEGISSIEKYAFAGCDKLKDIGVHSAEPPKCETDAFLNVCKNSCVLHVPSGTVKAYSNAAVWKDFKISEYGWPTYKV